jgi:hypothetical protein
LSGADYVFRVGHVVGWVHVSGGLDQTEELDAAAQEFAIALLERARAASATAGPSPPSATVSPEAVYAALATAPFREDELPAGLAHVAVPVSELGDESGPVGTVTVLARQTDASDEPDAAISYIVYRGVAEAVEAFRSFSGAAYVFVPQTIAPPARCSSTGPIDNECVVLIGNVLVLGDARQVDFGPDFAQPRPTGPTADGMARAGLAHLERVFGGLP